MMKYIRLLLLLLIPVLSGCNNTDDVQKIFTGKTWKLTYITVKDENKMIDGIPPKSLEILETIKSTYTITFIGATEDHTIAGTFSGKVITANLNGTWNANGRDNNFRASIQNVNETDLLAKEFIKGLTTATSYRGDESNLYLYYTPTGGQKTYSLVFHVAR